MQTVELDQKLNPVVIGTETTGKFCRHRPPCDDAYFNHGSSLEMSLDLACGGSLYHKPVLSGILSQSNVPNDEGFNLSKWHEIYDEILRYFS